MSMTLPKLIIATTVKLAPMLASESSQLTPCWREMDSNPRSPIRRDNAFRASSFPTCARATAAFENARRPVQQLLLPVVDPVRMNAVLTRQLGDRPVPPTAATTTPSL
jgi:hypothetical protein